VVVQVRDLYPVRCRRSLSVPVANEVPQKYGRVSEHGVPAPNGEAAEYALYPLRHGKPPHDPVEAENLRVRAAHVPRVARHVHVLDVHKVVVRRLRVRNRRLIVEHRAAAHERAVLARDDAVVQNLQLLKLRHETVEAVARAETDIAAHIQPLERGDRRQLPDLSQIPNRVLGQVELLEPRQIPVLVAIGKNDDLVFRKIQRLERGQGEQYRGKLSEIAQPQSQKTKTWE